MVDLLMAILTQSLRLEYVLIIIQSTMNKEFTFPTFEEWKKSDGLYLEIRTADIEEAKKVLRRVEKYYAIDFLTSLMEFVNEGWKPGYKATYMQPEIYYVITYSYMEDDYVCKWRQLTASAEHNLDGELFLFESVDKVNSFLLYVGCGTSTHEQLNILYNITDDHD